MDKPNPTVDRRQDTPRSEQLIGQWQRRDRALRTIELLIVTAVLLFNVFLLYQIRTNQKEIRQTNTAAQQRQEQLLEEAKANSARDHQETIRYLRCLALLQPPYIGTPEQLDNCIAQSRLGDDQQNPPIQNNQSAGNAGGSESTNPKVPAGSAPAIEPEPTNPQQPGPTEMILGPLGTPVAPVTDPVLRCLMGIDKCTMP